jgi:hypothetical protein
MSTKYIARAYCSIRKQWLAFLEVETQQSAEMEARNLMSLIAYDEKCDSVHPWTLVEVATVDAHATILKQWVGLANGYHLVRGRGAQS